MLNRPLDYDRLKVLGEWQRVLEYVREGCAGAHEDMLDALSENDLSGAQYCRGFYECLSHFEEDVREVLSEVKDAQNGH